jgi:cytochrome P450 family 3 subfamily A
MIEANKNKLNENNIDEENKSDINFKSSTNQKITTIEMTAQCVLFFVAGFDTTGSTLAHVFYYLAKYQDSQQKLYEEISSIDKYTNESLTELKYLNAIILETLRLSPPIMRIERVSVEDYILGDTGIGIPAGSVVTFCPYSLHRDRRFFEDPDQFRPERFIGEERHNSHAFIAFGGGPQNCLGMRFAMIQMRICLAKLCKRFRFKLSPNTKVCISNRLLPKIIIKARIISTRKTKKKRLKKHQNFPK